MKKATKVLSVLLTLCMLVCSVPFYAVNAGDYTEGFHDGDVSYVRDSNDLGRLNINLDYIEYQFVQTEDNQQFEFTQAVNFQKTSGLRYAAGQYFKLYTGELSDIPGSKYTQYPATVTNNPTSDFISTYGATFTYTATKEYSQREESANFPDGAFGFAGTIADFGGCPNYGWDMNVKFNGNGTERGGIETGFWRELYWIYADIESDNEDSKTHRYLRIFTKVSVSDIRDITELVAEARLKLNDSNESEKFKTNLQNVLNTIPEDLLNGTKYYPQSTVDKYYQNLYSVADDIADYSDYDTALRRAQALITDNTGKNHYTSESLTEFTNRINEINNGLDRNLGDTDAGDAIIAKAVQDINDAYKLLVNQSDTASDSYELYGAATKVNVLKYDKNPYDNSDCDTNYGNSFLYAFVSNTSHKFMQLTDGEKMTYGETFTAFRNIKWYDDILKIRSFTFDTSDSCTKDNHSGYVPALTVNNTTDFVNRLDKSVYNGTALTSWKYNSSFDTSEIYSKYPSPDNLYDNDEYTIGTNNLISSDGTFCGSDVTGIIGIVDKEYAVYSADANIIFYGNDYNGDNNTSTSSGAYTLNYYQKLDWSYRDTAAADYTDRDVHIGTTIKVTDCRTFLNDYYDAIYLYDTLSATGLYTNASLNNLQYVINSVSTTASGDVYKEQSVVDGEDTALKDAMGLVELKADYSKYNEAYAEAAELIALGNEDEEITPAAFLEFTETVNNINNNLDKNLGVSNQSVIDKAAQDILNAIDKMQKSLSNLEYTELLLKDTSSLEIDRTHSSVQCDIIVLEEKDAVIDDLKEQFKNNNLCLKFFTYQDVEITDTTKKVGTAGSIRLYRKDADTGTETLVDKAYVVMLGDVNGDATVNDADYDIALPKNLAYEDYPNPLFFRANDIQNDGVIDVLDTFYVSRMRDA